MMGQDNRSAYGLRTNIVQEQSGLPGNDLASLNASELPDGAVCFVTTTRAIYRLDKDSTAGVITSFIVAAVGGGRWIYEGMVGGAGVGIPTTYICYGAEGETITNIDSGALAPGTWSVLGPAAGGNSSWFINKAPVTPFSSLFVIASSTGIITYLGPDNMLVLVQAVVSFGTAAAAAIGWAIDHDGDISGATQSIFESISNAGGAGDTMSVTVLRQVLIDNGDTMQIKVKNFAGAEAVSTNRCQIALTPTILGV